MIFPQLLKMFDVFAYDSLLTYPQAMVHFDPDFLKTLEDLQSFPQERERTLNKYYVAGSSDMITRNSP